MRQSIRNTMLFLSAGSVAGQLFLLCATPILSRIYTPADFGALAPYTFWVTVIGSAAALRYDHAIAIAPSRRTATTLATVAMCLSFITAMAATGVLGLLAGYGRLPEQYAAFMWLLPIGVLLFASNNTVRAFSIRTKQFRTTAWSDAGRGATAAVSQIGFGLLNASMTALAAGIVVGQFVSTAIAFRSRPISRIRRHRDWKRSAISELIRYRRFALFSTPSAVINTAGMLLPATFIGWTYGGQPAGLYLLAQTIIQAPLGIVTRAASQTLTAHLRLHLRSTNEAHQNAKALELYVAFRARLVLFVAIPVLVGFPILSGSLPMILGDAWQGTQPIIVFMTAAWAAQGVGSPLACTLQMLERPDLHFAWDITRLVAVISAIGIPATLGSEFNIALAALSGSQAILYVLLALGCKQLLIRRLVESADHNKADS